MRWSAAPTLCAGISLMLRGERKRISHRAEKLAADLWGAHTCFFSTAGSTLSKLVAVQAAANPGDTVLVSRNTTLSGPALTNKP